MSRDEAIAELKTLKDIDNTEAAHMEADEVLCELLKSLGYDAVVDAYEQIDKWYS